MYAYRSDLVMWVWCQRHIAQLIEGGDRGAYSDMIVQDVHMTAWGSFALEVPSRNFRSFSLVSGEKVYKRDSEDYVMVNA